VDPKRDERAGVDLVLAGSYRSYPADPRSEEHPHLQLVIASAGALDMTIGGERGRVEAGRLAVIPPGVEHRFGGRGEAGDHRMAEPRPVPQRDALDDRGDRLPGGELRHGIGFGRHLGDLVPRGLDRLHRLAQPGEVGVEALARAGGRVDVAVGGDGRQGDDVLEGRLADRVEVARGPGGDRRQRVHRLGRRVLAGVAAHRADAAGAGVVPQRVAADGPLAADPALVDVPQVVD